MSGRVGVGVMVSACNRLSVGETSGVLVLVIHKWQLLEFMRAMISARVSSPRIRPLFVLNVSLILILYFAFLAAHIVLLYQMGSHKEVLIGDHQLPQKDFGLFWCAGNGLIEQLAYRFGFHFSETYRQICQNNILAASAPVEEAWPYPPTMGLLVVPFALLPLKAGFWIWRGFCLVIAALLLRIARVDWKVVVLGLASPAAWHDFTNGQNGMLTGTFLLVALLLARRKPALAGICAGILTVKPHLGLPIVVAALRLRGWKLIGYASFVAVSLAVFATILWGKAGWSWFFGTAQHNEWAWAAQSFTVAFPGAGITTYFMARSFGLSNFEALVVQLISAILALALMWRLWKPGFIAEIPGVIITICLNIWVVPHGYMYDLVAFSTAMAFLIVKLTGWARFVAALLWLMAGYTGVVSVMVTHILCFPLFAAAGAYLAWRFRHEAALQ